MSGRADALGALFGRTAGDDAAKFTSEIEAALTRAGVPSPSNVIDNFLSRANAPGGRNQLTSSIPDGTSSTSVTSTFDDIAQSMKKIASGTDVEAKTELDALFTKYKQQTDAVGSAANDGRKAQTSSQAEQEQAGKTGGTGSTDSSNRGPREAFVLEQVGKTGMPTSTKILILGGMSVAAYVIYLGAMTAGTHRNKVKINSITVQKIDNSKKKLIIGFDRSELYYPPTTAGASNELRNLAPDSFNPCLGDSVQFNQPSLLPTGVSYLVRASKGDTVEIVVPDTDLINLKSSSQNTQSPVYTEDQTDSYTLDLSSKDPVAYMTVYSSFSSQALDGMVDMVSLMALAAANALSNLGGAALSVLGAGAGAARQGFCTVMPVFCDSTIWILAFIGIVALIIFVAIS